MIVAALYSSANQRESCIVRDVCGILISCDKASLGSLRYFFFLNYNTSKFPFYNTFRFLFSCSLFTDLSIFPCSTSYFVEKKYLMLISFIISLLFTVLFSLPFFLSPLISIIFFFVSFKTYGFFPLLFFLFPIICIYYLPPAISPSCFRGPSLPPSLPLT